MTGPKRQSQKTGNRGKKHAPERSKNKGHEDSRSYGAFLVNLRHELRTPLTAIISYSEILLEDAGGHLQDHFITDLRKIQALGRQLLTLVENSLDTANRETTGTEGELEDFGISLRHDLRTPLNAIIGYSEILLEDAAEQGLKGLIPDIDKIRSAGARFLTFIDDIANFSKMKTMTGDTGTLQASSMIRSVLDAVRPLEEDRQTFEAVDKGSLLVIDDNEINRELISRQLERQGHTVTSAADGRQAIEIMKEKAFDLILLDIMMPEMNGYQVLQHLKSQHTLQDIPVIVISALDDMDSVVRCIQMGAEDYLLKPFNPVLLKARIKTCLEKRRLRELSEALERRNLKEEVQFIAESRAMQHVLNTVRTVSRNPVNVLIHGDSGTGKEVIARMIHNGSDRRDKPFIAVNCASIPDNLMESEFFGYEKGAFTGAVSSRGGRFEEADGGTLFLDEIVDMPLVIQPKFLRVIQEGEGSRLGSNKPIRYDLRIISAANRDIREEVASGRFREDLFYRIFSVEIYVPALRERKEDIVPLALFFMYKVSNRFKKKIAGFSSDVLNFFEEYPWPGNVRQLLHEVERLVALTPDGERVSLKHCSQELLNWGSSPSITASQNQPLRSLPEKVEEMEITCIKDALRKTKGKKAPASKLLGITRQGLDKKIKRYKISQSSENNE